MTSTLHTDTRSLERAGFLLIIANTRSQKKDIRRLRIHIYIYIYRYTIYVSHSSPSRKRAPAFSSARVSIFRGKFFRNYPSLLYPRASSCTPAGKTKKSNSSVSRVAAARTRPDGEKRRQSSSVRGCSFPQRTLYAFYVVFRRVYF